MFITQIRYEHSIWLREPDLNPKSCIFSAEKILRSARRLWQSTGLSFTTASPFRLFARGLITLGRIKLTKEKALHSECFFGCGSWTWTNDLRVMSPTSYQLLHPAILTLTYEYIIHHNSQKCKHFFNIYYFAANRLVLPQNSKKIQIIRRTLLR